MTSVWEGGNRRCYLSRQSGAMQGHAAASCARPVKQEWLISDVANVLRCTELYYLVKKRSREVDESTYSSGLDLQRSN